MFIQIDSIVIITVPTSFSLFCHTTELYVFIFTGMAN